jgi:maleylpyruvate isomerase
VRLAAVPVDPPGLRERRDSVVPMALYPSEDLDRVADAQRRFLAAIAGIDDAVVAAPSLLPGWTVGHVLTHVARNADSHRRRADAAVAGAIVEQYAGGWDGRAAEIEVGAARPAGELIEDVRVSADRMAATWLELPPEAWDVASPDVGGTVRALSELPARRWQELEVHVVDLGIGISHRDWSTDFVAVWLPRLRSSLHDRVPAGAHLLGPVFADDRDELAWLYGRLERPDLPELDPWA